MQTLSEYIKEVIEDKGNYYVISEGDNLRVINLDTNKEIINESNINEGLLKWLKGKFKKWFHSFTTGNMSDDDFKKSYKTAFNDPKGKVMDKDSNKWHLENADKPSILAPNLYKYSKLNGGLFKHYEYFYKKNKTLLQSGKIRLGFITSCNLIIVVQIASEIDSPKTSEMDKKIHEGLDGKYKGHIWLWEQLNTLDKSDDRYKIVFTRDSTLNRMWLGNGFRNAEKPEEVTCFLNEKYNGNAMKEHYDAKEIKSKYNGDGAPLGVLGDW